MWCCFSPRTEESSITNKKPISLKWNFVCFPGTVDTGNVINERTILLSWKFLWFNVLICVGKCFLRISTQKLWSKGPLRVHTELVAGVAKNIELCSMTCWSWRNKSNMVKHIRHSTLWQGCSFCRWGPKWPLWKWRLNYIGELITVKMVGLWSDYQG